MLLMKIEDLVENPEFKRTRLNCHLRLFPDHNVRERYGGNGIDWRGVAR